MFDSFQERKTSRHPAVVILVVLVVGGVGVAWCAREAQRREIEQMNNVLSSALAMTAPGPRELSPLALPGMNINAPRPATIRGDYMNGSTVQDLSAQWGVSWQRGSLPSVDALRSVVVSTIAAQQGLQIGALRSIDFEGAPGHQFELVNQLGTAAVVTYTECDRRIVQIISTGTAMARDDSAKMVASFRCTPDPVSGSTNEADVVVDVRPGWTRTKPAGQLMLVNDREVLVQPRLMLNELNLPIDTLIPGAIRSQPQFAISDGPKQMRDRKVWFGTVDIDGKRSPFALVASPCPGAAGIATVYVFTMQGAPLDEGLDLALTGRCLAAGEQEPVYPGPRDKAPQQPP